MQDKLKKLEKKYDVDWREYRIGDLFEVRKGKRLPERVLEDTKGNIALISQSTQDNMVARYSGLQGANEIYQGNAITFGVNTKGFGFQKGKFYTIADVLFLKADFLNSRNANFIKPIIAKALPQDGWDKIFGLEKMKDLKVKLPTFNNEIAFGYIEEFVETLEAERLQTLEAYLKVTGLKNTVLTDAERESLARLDTVGGAESIRWREFNLPDLFSIKNTHNILSRDIVENSGAVPYLTAGQGNNAVGTYISYDESQIDEGNSIFIGGKTFVVTYQERDYFSNDSHNLALYYNEYDKRTKENQLFMATAIYKSLSHLYSWGNSISRSKIQSDIVALPVSADGEIDFDFVSNLMSAMQKVVIKGVVDWADKRIEKTRGVVGNDY
ncbi:MAG: restriction endonuclease subunit S [Streptococcaceae bacterium]|jgi:hypothetical protein|nr:restriction endonuclease subunit S [Streptococcaceae bacterium]